MMLFKKIKKSNIQCRVCSHYCIIKPGEKGICGVRENCDGDMVTRNENRIVAQSVDPIEKKPIFHLLPGSSSYSIAGAGCNFICTFCQNAHIAQIEHKTPVQNLGVQVNPEQIVEAALASGCESISYTYTEPTVFFELAFETAKLAVKKGLHNIFVSNGFMSREALDLLIPYLSAANVDLKAFDEKFYQKYCGGKLKPVKQSIEQMNENGVLVELTTLLIPGLNDDDEQLTAMAEYIADRLGPQTPWHISRFHPCHRMTDRGQTPVSSLERAYRIGKRTGLFHVYIGNVPGGGYEDTLCHECGKILIRRYGYQTDLTMERGGKCPDCHASCKGVFN